MFLLDCFRRNLNHLETFGGVPEQQTSAEFLTARSNSTPAISIVLAIGVVVWSTEGYLPHSL